MSADITILILTMNEEENLPKAQIMGTLQWHLSTPQTDNIQDHPQAPRSG